jgi:acyl carrier protein
MTILLREQLKEVIIKELKLEDVQPEEIENDLPLIGEGLGLDSIDAIEIVFQVKKHFGVQIRDMKEGRKVLRTINTLAEYIEQKRAV